MKCQYCEKDMSRMRMGERAVECKSCGYSEASVTNRPMLPLKTSLITRRLYKKRNK